MSNKNNLEKEIREYLANGGKITQLDEINLNGARYASEYRINRIKEFCYQSDFNMKTLRARVNKRIKNQPRNWIANVLQGTRRLPVPYYKIIIEEMKIIELEKDREALLAMQKRNCKTTNKKTIEDNFKTWCKRTEVAQQEISHLRNANHHLAEINDDMNKTILQLREKLAKYEYDDYVVVPREPNNDMMEGAYHVLRYEEACSYDIYKAMIEAGEVK